MSTQDTSVWFHLTNPLTNCFVSKIPEEDMISKYPKPKAQWHILLNDIKNESVIWKKLMLLDHQKNRVIAQECIYNLSETHFTVSVFHLVFS